MTTIALWFGVGVQIYAHRGSSGTQPENTLRAFRQAVADGADGVEFDVRASRDGVPVVIHDRDVSRTTDGSGLVDRMDLAEIRRLDAGDGERVPTLAEVLDLVAGRLRLYVEIKQPGIEQGVLDVLAARPDADWLIGSFDPGVLRAARARSATAELWPIAVALTRRVLAVAAEVGASAVSLHTLGVTAQTARRCAAAGLGLAAWTIDDPAEARRIRDLGAVGLCTNVPATVVAALA